MLKYYVMNAVYIIYYYIMICYIMIYYAVPIILCERYNHMVNNQY